MSDNSQQKIYPTTPINELKKYAESNIKAKKCKRLVLKKDIGGNRCHCGRQQEDHDDYNNPIDEPWDKNRDLVEMTTNAYGEMKLCGFKEFPGTQIKYIRASETEHLCDNLYHIMTEIWKFPKPDLIISIHGSANKVIPLSNEQKSVFKRGLINVSKTASTWIITGGFNFGLPKLVGVAARDHKIASQHKTSTVIGMCTWGAVYNRQDLILSTDEEITYHNAVGPFNLTTQALLDTNHDAFILYDSGIDENFGMEMEFRGQFETFVSKKENCNVVNVIVGGGNECINIVHKAIEKDIAVVIMKGSNNAADLICGVVETDDKSKIDEVINAGLTKYKKVLSNNEETELQKILINLYNLKKEKLIHIFSVSDNYKSLDRIILEAAFSGNIDRKPRTYEEMLKMTMDFDRPDVAKKLLMEPPELIKTLNKKVYKEFIITALKKNQWKFVQLFLSRGTKVEWFLTKKELEDLYFNDVMEDYINPAVFSIVEILLTDTNVDNKNRMCKIGQVVKKMTNNLIANMYDNINNFTKYPPKNESVERIYTEQDLFIWSLLTQRWEMSKIFWESGKDHIGSALIAGVICNSLNKIARSEKELDMENTLKSYEEEYENLAIKLVIEAYSRDKTRTHLLLIRTLPYWYRVNILEIAHKGKFVNFLYQSACQTYLNTVWIGGITKKKSLKCVKKNSDISSQKASDALTVENGYLKDFRFKLKRAWIDLPRCKKVRNALKAPRTKFIINVIFYLAFLVIFSYTLLVELLPLSAVTSSYERKMEYLVYLFVGASLIEEIRQAFLNYEYSTLRERLTRWISSVWNIIDLFIYIIFILAVILRHIKSISFSYARNTFSITLSIYYLRSLQFYYVNQSIGPKVISVRRMMKDIFFFLSIYIVVILAYGTLAQALLYNNSLFNPLLLKNIVYMPYWQSYGDLQIEYVEGTVPLNGVQPKPNTIVIIAFAVYMLFTNVLLMNMLVAMFGITFQKVEENSNRIWAFKRFRLIEEFYYRPLLPPPLNLFHIPFMICEYHKMKWTKREERKKNNFVVNLSHVEDVRSAEFEKQCLEKILRDNPLLKLEDESEQSTSTLFLMDSSNEVKYELKVVSESVHKVMRCQR